jgi:glycosyltransferase involved in cell wall biosynthesis
MKPRVLVFSTAYFPHVGGAEVAIKELTERLTDFEFDLITARLQRDLLRVESIGNTTVYRIGFGNSIDKLLLPIWGTILALKLHSQYQYKIFWAMMVTFASGIPYIVNICRQLIGAKEVPIVLTLQEGDSEEHIRKRHFGLINLAWRLALPLSSQVTVISNYLDTLARSYGYKGPITLIPNGVAGYFFSENIKTNDSNLIVTASRLVKKNGIDTLIKALALLPENFSLAIAGEGVEEVNLRELSRELGLESRIRFVGYQKPELLPEFLREGQVFVRPSRSEGLGNAFLEAMALGLPVIGTPVGGIPDIIKDGETGFLVAVDDQAVLAEKIKYTSTSEHQAEISQIMSKAYHMVDQNYRWDSIAERMKTVFKTYVIS